MNMRTLAASALLALILSPLALPARAAQPSPALQEIYALQAEIAHVLLDMNTSGSGKAAPSRASAVKDQIRRLDSLIGLDDEKMNAVTALGAWVVERPKSGLAVEHLSKIVRFADATALNWRVQPAGDDVTACLRAVETDLTRPLRLRLPENGVVWIRISAPHAGIFAYDTIITEFDTRMSLYRDCRDIDRVPLHSSDDAIGLGSIVGFDAKGAGETRIIKLERVGGRGDLAIAKGGAALSISGRVTRSEGGAPIANVRVVAMNQYRHSGTTDSDGQYQIYVYSEGPHLVRTDGYFPVEDDALVNEAYPNVQCMSNFLLYFDDCIGPLEQVTVVAGQPVTDIDFALSPGATILGRLTDEVTQAPVEGASAVAILATPPSGQVIKRSALTDSSGRFRIRGLPSSSWIMEFQDTRFVLERWNNFVCGSSQGSVLCPDDAGDPLTVAAGETISVVASLTPFDSMPIRVTSAGSPLQASVDVFTAAGQFLGVYASTSDGIVHAGPLPDGVYRFRANASNHLGQIYGGPNCYADCDARMLEGATVFSPLAAGITLSIELSPLPRISGTVVRADNGLPLANARVALVPQNGGLGSTALSNGDGVFESAKVLPGLYLAHVAMKGYIDVLHAAVPCEELSPFTSCGPATPIVVSANAPPPSIRFELSPAGSISGHVGTSVDSQLAPNQVYFSRLSPNGAILQSEVLTTSGGRYLAGDVPPGTHRVVMDAQGYRPQLFAGLDCDNSSPSTSFVCPIASATPLTWTGTELVAGIDFILTPNYSRLIRVLDAENLQPLSGIAIDQWSLDRNWVTSSVTDANGLASLLITNPVSSSDFVVLTSTDNNRGYINQVYDAATCAVGTSAYEGTCSLSGATLVPVSNDNNASYPPIQFLLRSAIPLFQSGFE